MGDFLVSPSLPSVSDFSFLPAKLPKMEVRRLSFKVGFVSGVAATEDSEVTVVSVAVGDVIGSSAFVSFFGYLNVSRCKSSISLVTYLKLGVLSFEEFQDATFV